MGHCQEDCPTDLQKTLPSVKILGVRVHSLTVDDLHRRIIACVKQKRHVLVLNVNAHGLNLAYRVPWLRDCLNRAEIVFADGVGIILAARLWGCRIPARITYADWTWQLAQMCADNDLSLFLLGAKPGTAEQAAAHLQECYPKLRIAGIHHGYFDKTAGHPDNEAVVQAINAAKPDILLVGFGMPLQEQWLLENWEKVDARVALTGGAVFDYVSGRLQRGPRWMTDHGLEWLARLLIEPHRLWRRYVLGNPLFLWRVIRERFGLTRPR
jgi:N-acetylglucosaminyldiphosphoundecaprenol N-acetyl-beta-D-mannosaminyltransferase